MSKRTCTIEDCGHKVHGHGWCHMHYQRWRRYGNPTALLPRHDACQVDGCPKPLRSQVSGLCEMHYYRRRRHGDVLTVLTARKPIVLYRAAHARVQAARGPAAAHPCTDCANPAEHWSYDHTDPDELRSDTGQPYSLDVGAYEPRCVPCHAKFDGVGWNQYSGPKPR